MAWAEQLQDAILSNEGLRDGLTDEEAQPLIDWGLALAQQTGDMLDSHPETDPETYQDALLKLMTRINWIAMYRAQKGAEWTTQTLQKLNELSQTLRGEDAPVLSEEAIARYSTRNDDLSNGQLVLELIQQLSPPQLGESYGEETII